MTEEPLKIAGKLVQYAPAKGKAQLMLWNNLKRLPDCIPAHINATQFIMAVCTEANKLPEETTARSIVTAAFNCAVMGLIPGPHLGHAYFVPLKRTVKYSGEKVMECHMWTGYKGFIHMGYSSDFLAGLQAEVVLEGENPKRGQRASGPWIEHDMPFDRVEEWEKVTAAYCVYQTQTGKSGVFVVPKKELVRLRKRYGNVWNSNPIEMAKKTPIRRVANHWDLSRDLGNSLMLESQTESEETQTVLAGAEWEGMQEETAIVWKKDELRPQEDSTDQEGREPEEDLPQINLSFLGINNEGFNKGLVDCKTDVGVNILIASWCAGRHSDEVDALTACGARRKKQLVKSDA